MPTVKDLTAAQAFVELLIGWHSVGVSSEGDEVQARNAPSILAHLQAVLGKDLPHSATNRVLRSGELLPLSAYLRSIADVLDAAHATVNGNPSP